MRISFGRTISQCRVGHRQAALEVAPLAAGLGDDRVDQRPAARRRVVDEQALLHADLRGGQPEAGRVVHRLEHVVGQADERAVDVVDLGGPLLQHRVAEDPDGVGSHGRQG